MATKSKFLAQIKRKLLFQEMAMESKLSKTKLNHSFQKTMFLSGGTKTCAMFYFESTENLPFRVFRRRPVYNKNCSDCSVSQSVSQSVSPSA